MAERVSALDATIRALGAEMGPWNDMDIAMSLPGDMNAEHDAIREAVGMWDTSALKNFYVRGANALATIAYLVVLAGVTAWLVADRGSAMADLVGEIRPWPLLGLVAASILPFLANTAFWTLALRELGETVTWRQVTGAAAETTLTRYLPGGIWLAAGRGVALARRGVGTPAVVAMGGLEVALATPVALLVGSVLLAGSPNAPAWLGWLAAGLLIVAATLARPALNGALAGWARRRNQELPAVLTTAEERRLTNALVAY